METDIEIEHIEPCLKCHSKKRHTDIRGFKFTYCRPCLKEAEVGPFCPRPSSLEYSQW